MTGNYAYTPAIWPSVLMVLLMVPLALYSERRRSVPGATPFMVACLFAAAWAVGALFEVAAEDQETKISWFKFQAFIQLPMIVAITCFILEYTWPRRWLTRRNLILLFSPCLLGLILILTENLHHLTWRGLIVNGTVYALLGSGSWLMVFYFMGVLGALNLIIFGWLFLHSPQHRWPVLIMLFGQFMGRTLFMLERIYAIRFVPPLDLLGMSFEFLMYAIAFFGFRIFDPISLARQAAIAQMREGMLVLDLEGRVASLNPAAAAILGSPAKRLLNRPVQEILPAFHNLTTDLQPSGADQVELNLGTGSEIRYYQLEISPLKDWRGLEAGRLLLLHDVTVQKKAQAQLLDQERALAMLHERERLSRELHDTIGQTLGYAGFQVEAVSKLVQDGRGEAAIAQLDRLAGVVREAHADLREYILDLHASPAPQQPFFAALRHYLEGFTNNYGIQVLLSIDERLGDDPFPPDARMHVFRILQEALSNARKHGQARCVQVAFALKDGLVQMTVQDEGTGFDPTQVAGESHFGLHFMRERAEQLNGSLQVDSAPGKGTCVIVEVPIQEERYGDKGTW